MMYKFSLTVLLLLGGFTPSFSQTFNSTISIPKDTTAEWHTGKQIPKKQFRAAPFIIPVALAAYGFVAVYDHGALKRLDVSTRDELQEDHPRFAVHVDDYLQFAPAAAVYALNLSGVKGKHNLFDASMLYLTSAALMGGSTHLTKHWVGRERPNHGSFDSFPSGHTANAFMGAEFLHQEYKDSSPWIGYSGFIVATATGTLRMYNNKHWFSDVVAGAGYGIASTKIAYLVYPLVKRLFAAKKPGNFSLMPFHQDNGSGLMLSGRF